MPQHVYIAAKLGHADQYCKYCGATPREAAAVGYPVDCPKAPDELQSLRAENERLRKALRVFADFSESFHTVADEDDDEDIWLGHDGRFIRCGDIRAARAALEGEG